MAQKDSLQAALTARARMQKAEHEFREAAIRAVAEGVPVMHVAKALELSRTSLYRWGVAQAGLDERKAGPHRGSGRPHDRSGGKTNEQHAGP